MMEFTTNQWAVLFLVLLLGWLLGLMSSSGGERWRRQYEEERDARLAAERVRDDPNYEGDRLAWERERAREEERLAAERARDLPFRDDPRPRPL